MAKVKLKEGVILLDNGCYDGAQYLLGYVIEFSLKARVCRILDIEEYPDLKDFKTHKLDKLLNLSGLEKKFYAAKTKNLSYMTNWSIIESWKEELRYNSIGTTPKNEVEGLLDAIGNKKNGIFQWIKKFW